MSLGKISKSRIAKLSKEGRGLRGTFTAKTMSEVITAQQARDAEVREALFGKKPEKSKKTDRQKAKAAADKWFSMFIRLRDSDENGIATCVTSGRRMHWRQGDCGHWISRAKEATRYDERNAHFQSKQSNRFQGGHFLEHERAIERIHGAGTAQILKDKALTLCKRTASDYQFIADTYRSRVERIKEESPNKFKP
jgi:hypothetical protein